MNWLKQIVVDLLATLAIIVAVLYDSTSFTLIVYIYTALMVLARIATLVSANFQAITKKKVSEAPAWVYHTLHAVNVGVLVAGAWYILAAGWVFIWGVAAYTERKSHQL
ncbi:MAG: hypothetical protein ACNA78_09680 [Balneolaceae bacterium]